MNKTYSLPNRTRIHANEGFIGIRPPVYENGKLIGWDISEGFDSAILHEELTSDDCIYLADMMIMLWQDFKTYSEKRGKK